MFENQLTSKEIRIGLFAYINKKMYGFLVVCFLLPLVISDHINSAGSLGMGLLTGLAVGLLAELLLFLLLKRNFSTDQVATYYLSDDNIKIIDSKGGIHQFPYCQIKSIRLTEVFILCLSKQHFALVSKRCMTAEQIRVFERL